MDYADGAFPLALERPPLKFLKRFCMLDAWLTEFVAGCGVQYGLGICMSGSSRRLDKCMHVCFYLARPRE